MSLDVWLYTEVDTGGDEPHVVSLFDANITHNLNTMADEAGIYNELWRPEEIRAVHASDIVDAVEVGLKRLVAERERFEQLDSPGGWGTYEQFVPWVAEYLSACKEHPKAKIGVSR